MSELSCESSPTGQGSRLAATAPALVTLLALALLAACRTAAPTAGHGDVAFRLLWQGESDLDLHVVDPAGERLFYGHRASTSGGVLDVDCNAGSGRLCARPIENVYWPLGTAPAGRYRVWAEAHSLIPAEAPLALELLVLDGERVVARHAGSLAANGEALGPFAVDFPPAGPGDWRLLAPELDDAGELPWRTVECADGLRFRTRSGLRRTLLEVDGRQVELAPVRAGGSIFRGEGFTLWALGDQFALTTPEGEHGGCREVP